MTAHFWQWWQGYVTVCLRGPGLERLLNKIAGAGIVIWQVERRTTEVILARVRSADFCKLRPLLWGMKISVSILDRHGLPFLLREVKKRLLLMGGLILCLAFIVQLASYIWVIEIAGNEVMPLLELKLAAEELGLKIGVRKDSLIPRQIEKDLLLRFPGLAWAQVELKGVKARLNIVERNEGQGTRTGAGHIFAAEDGVVTQILVLRGTAQVEEGDTVQAGDILISGVYYDARGQKRFGAAEGIIKARVWHRAVGEASLVVWQPIKTGSRRLQFLVSIGPWTIPLGKAYSQETHLAQTETWSLSLGAAMLPLSLTRVVYSEVDYIPTAVPLEQAKATASRTAWETLLGRGVDQEEVHSRNEEVFLMADREGVRVDLTVETEQNIGLFLNQ